MADNRKRKKNYYKAPNNKKRRLGEELRPGLRGFFITCNGKEHPAIKEAYSILNEYADKMYGPEYPDNESDSENLEKALQKEVSDLKDSNARGAVRRFQRVKTKLNNVIFIKTSVADPYKLTESIFSDILSSQMRKTKFCSRFLPVSTTCYAKVDEIIKAFKKVSEPVFLVPNVAPIRFCVLFKCRCNSSVKRDDIMQPIVDIVMSNGKHMTDYNDPEILISLEIVCNICCISFLSNFFKFKKYNIDLIWKPDESNELSEKLVVPNSDSANEKPDKLNSTEKCNEETVKQEEVLRKDESEESEKITAASEMGEEKRSLLDEKESGRSPIDSEMESKQSALASKEEAEKLEIVPEEEKEGGVETPGNIANESLTV